MVYDAIEENREYPKAQSMKWPINCSVWLQPWRFIEKYDILWILTTICWNVYATCINFVLVRNKTNCSSCLISVCLIGKYRLKASPGLDGLTHFTLVSHFCVIANKKYTLIWQLLGTCLIWIYFICQCVTQEETFTFVPV